MENGKIYSIASLVLGILSILYSGAVIFGILAVVLAGISLKKKYSGRRIAIAGLVLGIIGLILTLLSVIAILSSFVTGQVKEQNNQVALNQECLKLSELEITRAISGEKSITLSRGNDGVDLKSIRIFTNETLIALVEPAIVQGEIKNIDIDTSLVRGQNLRLVILLSNNYACGGATSKIVD